MKRVLLWFMLLCFTGMAYATVPAVPFTVTYTCTGGFGPFAFTFPVYDASALTVTLNGVLLAPTNYTIVPVNNNYANGGSVTLGGSFPCTAGYTLILARVTPITQTIQFYDNMPSLPTITGRSVDKLTEIAQEIEGLLGSIGGGSVVITATAPIVVTPSPLSTLGVISCPTCSTGGSVTNVSGTANQIDVATGTTTPVISLDSNITFPGNIATGANAVNFGAATSLKVPVSSGCTAATAGLLCYDSTAKSTHFQTNNADSIAVALASAPAGSKCLHTSGTTGLATETSGDCSSLPGGTGLLRLNSGTPAVAEMSGDATTSGSNALTLATVNSNVGSFTSANITVNAKGLVTAASNGGGGLSGSGTTNTIPKWSSSSSIGNSSITDNGTTVATTEPLSAASFASSPSGGVGGGMAGPEGTVPSTIGGITIPSATNDGCYFDSTAHGMKCSYNNGSFLPVTRTIGSGTATMGTSLITSGACASVVTVSATGTATTDTMTADFNADPTGTTGYTPGAMLTIVKYPTANNVNFKVCNNTGSSITPSAVTLNWRVMR